MPAQVAGNKQPREFTDPAIRESRGVKNLQNTKKVDAMWLKSPIRNKKGQSLIEYAMVASVVAAAVVAMSTYVFRSVQASQQMIHKEFRSNQ